MLDYRILLAARHHSRFASHSLRATRRLAATAWMGTNVLVAAGEQEDLRPLFVSRLPREAVVPEHQNFHVSTPAVPQKAPVGMGT
jgi:hypothetical protein